MNSKNWLDLSLILVFSRNISSAVSVHIEKSFCVQSATFKLFIQCPGKKRNYFESLIAFFGSRHCQIEIAIHFDRLLKLFAGCSFEWIIARYIVIAIEMRNKWHNHLRSNELMIQRIQFSSPDSECVPYGVFVLFVIPFDSTILAIRFICCESHKHLKWKEQCSRNVNVRLVCLEERQLPWCSYGVKIRKYNAQTNLPWYLCNKKVYQNAIKKNRDEKHIRSQRKTLWECLNMNNCCDYSTRDLHTEHLGQCIR